MPSNQDKYIYLPRHWSMDISKLKTVFWQWMDSWHYFFFLLLLLLFGETNFYYFVILIIMCWVFVLRSICFIFFFLYIFHSFINSSELGFTDLSRWVTLLTSSWSLCFRWHFIKGIILEPQLCGYALLNSISVQLFSKNSLHFQFKVNK